MCILFLESHSKSYCSKYHLIYEFAFFAHFLTNVTLQCTFDLRGYGPCSVSALAPNPLWGSCTFMVSRDKGRCDNPYDDPKLLNLDYGEVHARNVRCP